MQITMKATIKLVLRTFAVCGFDPVLTSSTVTKNQLDQFVLYSARQY